MNPSLDILIDIFLISVDVFIVVWFAKELISWRRKEKELNAKIKELKTQFENNDSKKI